MSICPTCMVKYPAGVSVCEADKTPLVPEETFAHVDRDPEPGDKIGEYVVEGKLGQGGFGSVWRAVHPVIGKPAAIKILSRQFSANPQMVSRFIAEARAVNQIRHRNIIDVFSFGQTSDGRQYYVMELLDGVTFDRYLRDHKRLSLLQAMPIFRGIARAMDAAHAKGILHRDLKPENIFLTFDEDGAVSPKLLDFGLVKLVGESSGSGSGQHKTKTGTPMGTPYYMSPEQCRGRDIDARSDVYSFGVIVFEVLTGKMPFEGESPMDVLVKHMSVDPPPASAMCPDVPPALDAAIASMLAKEPDARPATIGKALEALAAAANVPVAAGVAQVVTAPIVNASVPSEASAATMNAPTLAHVPGVSDAPPAVKVITGGGNATPAPPATGQTFLGAEADVAPPPARRGMMLIVGIAAAALMVGGVGAVFAFGRTKPPTTHAHTGVVELAPPPPVAPRATTSAAPTASAVEAKVAHVKFIDAPKGAVVHFGSELMGPATGTYEAPVGEVTQVTVSAKGFKPLKVKITPTEDVEVAAKLEKLPTGGSTGAGGKPINPDLENRPF